ncbi:MAG: restriction endonuclease subunit S [Clostridia bacterium]|nr:restriction endonuclease subunit S [Clostridia bacterium]
MKNKIDINKWKEFKIGDLFDIHPTKAYKMNNSSLLVEDGINPVVVNSCYNNGIGGYTNYDCTEEGNIITFSDTTSADSIFYQKDNFVGYPHVQGMYPIGKYKDKWSEYSYLFFITLFREKAINLNYDYVNKFTRESAKEIKIKLPVDNNDNPDWNYMERYMKKIEEQSRKSIKGLNNCSEETNKVYITENWGRFVIEDLFDVKRPAARSQSDYEEGEIPFVASGNYNNGVLKYLMPKDNEVLEKGNCITVSPVDGSSFYQKEDFLGRGGAGSSIILLYNENLNEKNGIFIATIIRKICNKYGYSDMGSKESIRKEIIKLPVDDEGNPDWSYMEQYMTKLLSRTKSKLSCLNAI